jgi:diguanylate cyclase (GGDEF)-like protein
MSGPIGRRVGRKLALAVSAILSILSIAFVGILLRFSRHQLEDQNKSWLVILSDTIGGSIETTMEAGHGPGFKRVVADAKDHPEIDAIRILDLQGRIAFSADDKEVGKPVDERIARLLPLAKATPALVTSTADEPQPVAVLVRNDPGAESGVMVEGPGRIDALRPVMNDAACQKCHGKKDAQLGVLQISMSTGRAEAAVVRYQRMLGWLAILPIFFVVATILIATRIVVTRPLGTLSRAIRKAEQGDFLHRAHVPGEDEIATLAKDFNAMLGRITLLTAMNMERERELASAQEEMKARAALDEKARIIENTNKELSERNRELDVLFKLEHQISSTLDLDELFVHLTKIVGEDLGFRQFVVLLMDAEADHLVVKATHGFEESNEIRGMIFKKGEGVAGECARTGERILITDTRKDSRYLHYKGKRSVDGALLCIPLKVKDRVVGVLAFERTSLEGFSESEIQFLQAIANAAAVAIENAQLYERTRELSATDALTQLANRRAFYERLEHELRRADRFHRNVSVLMIDIDYFKKFNDTHGHLDGDDVLRRAADCFRENVREVDLVARYGGEEFVVILPDADKTEAGAVGEKLRNRVARTRFPKAESQPGGKLTISVGVASYPSDASDGGSLLDSADFALYRAKEGGRNKVVIFDEGLRRDLEKLRVGR